MNTAKEISALVAEHGVWLSAFLRGLTRCEADAEDSFQEVWLRLMKAGGLKAVVCSRAYLARVARSVVIDRYRRDWRLETTLDAPSETGDTRADELVDESPGPAMRVEVASTREAVIAALRALPEGPRLVALMRIEGELTFQAIADELGVPLGTVLTWMRTATMKLKECFGEKK